MLNFKWHHLFPHMKKTWLATQRFVDRDEELQAEINKWLQAQASNVYDEGICKLHQYDKRLNLKDDCMVK